MAGAAAPRRLEMPLSRAFVVALALEALAVGLAISWLGHPTPLPPPAVPMIVRIDRVSLPAAEKLVPQPPAPEPPKPEPPKPEPPRDPPKTTVTPPPPKPTVPRPPRPVVKEVPQLLPPPPDTPALPAASDPSPAPPPATPVPAAEAPAAMATARREAEDDFASHLHAAVQAATRFPAAARAMGRQGRVRVAFDFEDGRASQVEIIQSGDLPAFDEAARAAVEEARYPPPPPHWLHQKKRLMVWVEFLKKG